MAASIKVGRDTDVGAPLRTPFPDETLSSYLTAWCGHFSVKRGSMIDAVRAVDTAAAAALVKDPDFPPSHAWTAAVAAVTHFPGKTLDELARPRSFGYLTPAARTNACAACLAEASNVGRQYRKHEWALATVTTCFVHKVPLMEVPAVGWDWCEPTAGRLRGPSVMRHPERRASAVWHCWHEIPQSFIQAILNAEYDVWATGVETRSGRRRSQSGVPPVRIWRDLLTLLCASWEDFSAPSLATKGLPGTLYARRGVERVGGRNRPVLLEAPTFKHFCEISDPAERRACVLMAWEGAISTSRNVESSGRYGGLSWHRIVACMPEPAWAWLFPRASKWPAGWNFLIERWHRQRLEACRTAKLPE